MCLLLFVGWWLGSHVFLVVAGKPCVLYLSVGWWLESHVFCNCLLGGGWKAMFFFVTVCWVGWKAMFFVTVCWVGWKAMFFVTVCSVGWIAMNAVLEMYNHFP